VRHSSCAILSPFRSARRAAVRAASLAVAIALATPPEAAALDPLKALTQYSTAAWRSEDGLPNSTVQGLAQTADGYLWIATLEGIARFDGSTMTVFDRSNTPAILANDVQALLAGRDGSLWLAVYGGGLVRFRDGAFSSYAKREGFAAVTVMDMAEAANGDLWIATTSGLYRLRKGTFTAYGERDGLSSEQVRCVFVDREGTVWAGTRTGLDRFADGHFAHYRDESRADVPVTAIARDATGVLWLGTSAGVRRLESERLVKDPSVRSLEQEPVSALFLDRQDALWIATTLGLSRLRDEQLTSLTSAEGLGNGATAILEDREGSVWVGGEGGVTQLKDGPVITYSSLQGLSSDDALSIAPARAGGLWIGSGDGRLDRFVDGRFQALDTSVLQGSRVLALFDEGVALWLGTDLGLHRLQAGRWTTYSTRDGLAVGAVRSILRDRAGRLWVGTDGGGLARLEAGRFATISKDDGLPSNQIRGLLEARDGTLWVASYGGLTAIKDGRMTHRVLSGDLTSPLARSLYEDDSGVLWIGTYGAGLYRLANGRLTSYSSRDGLFSDVVYQIVEGNRGRFWMSSNKGIFAVQKSELEAFAAGRTQRVASLVYGRSDGMRSEECSGGSPAGWKAPDGRIWFATAGGVVVIDPSNPGARRLAPPPLIQAASVDGNAVDHRADVLLGPEARRLEIRFASVGLAAPERTRHMFLLEGFDRDWVDGAKRSAQYTSLPPGGYRFRVRAMGEDGVWREADPALGVRVQAHWYRSRTFTLALVAGALLAGWAAYRVRVRVLVSHERELQHRVEEAVANVKVLSGLLPICSSCKNVRDDKGYWNRIESYISEHTQADFSHGICPDCAERLYPDASRRLREKRAGQPT
jgi:ligand-binding sensor domain-containing protein